MFEAWDMELWLTDLHLRAAAAEHRKLLAEVQLAAARAHLATFM